MNPYAGKSVLVTGGTGFIGSHLVERLEKAGKSVIVVSSSGRVQNIKSTRAKIITADITKKNQLEKIKEDLDLVFHLAANVSVSDAIKNPEKTKATNVEGTRNILDLAVEKGVKKFVYMSTSAVYAWSWKPINEQSETAPVTIYGQTKLMGENLCMAYNEKFSLPLALPRFFNVYGVRQQGDVIPLFVRKALRNEDIPVQGGSQKRDFINVQDVVSALLVVGSEKRAENEIINFGTGKATSIQELAEKIILFAKSKSAIVHHPLRSEDGSSVCDYSKARSLFGWEPSVPLDAGLKEVIECAKREERF